MNVWCRAAFAAVSVLVSVAAASAAPVERVTAEKPWAYTGELAFVNSNGNSKATSFSTLHGYARKWALSLLELDAGALAAQSEGVTTSENFFAGEKAGYRLDDRNYLFERIRWDKDRFSGIRDRWDFSGGYGREIVKDGLNELRAEIGAGYTVEDRLRAETNKFGSGRFWSRYGRKLSDTSNFAQEAEYLANFKDSGDYRLNTETSVTAAMNANFSLKAFLRWKHVGSPPPGFGRNDTFTGVSLVAAY